MTKWLDFNEEKLLRPQRISGYLTGKTPATNDDFYQVGAVWQCFVRARRNKTIDNNYQCGCSVFFHFLLLLRMAMSLCYMLRRSLIKWDSVRRLIVAIASFYRLHTQDVKSLDELDGSLLKLGHKLQKHDVIVAGDINALWGINISRDNLEA